MNSTSKTETRFFEWNELPLLARRNVGGETVLNCAFDPPQEISSPGLLRRAHEISLQEFERLRAVHRAAWRQHFDDHPKEKAAARARR